MSTKNICKICKRGGVYNFQGVPYGILQET